MGAEQFSGRLNIWAMLKALLNQGVAIFPISGPPTDGSSGTLFGSAGTGSLLLDYTNGVLYINAGTKLFPRWTAASQGGLLGLGGLGNVGNAKMSYNFATDGGAVGVITPANSPNIPAKAIILGGTIDITAALTSGGAATISIGTSAGSSAASLKAPTAVATWTIGQMAVIPVFTAATYLKLTAQGQLNMTVAAFDLTAGAFNVNVAYLIGN